MSRLTKGKERNIGRNLGREKRAFKGRNRNEVTTEHIVL